MITTAVEAEARKRNIERRRETSRFAARDRRGKEADIFVDLKEVVPIVNEATVTHVDRIALLRVAATLCRMRKTASAVLKNDLSHEFDGGVWCEDTITECIDGFIMMADTTGSILYVTESVSLFLGLTQTDLTGRNMKEFMHPADYDEYVKMQGELNTEDHADPQSTVLRLKTVISPRGRNLNLKSALFKPVSFLVKSQKSEGHQIILLQGCSIPAGQGSVNATASAITKGGETPNGTFMTRHTCDMRISYVSDTLNFILKNDTRSLMGTSFYDLVHPADAHIVHKSMRELFSKGHCRTPYYRLIAASNTLAWVMTEATTINHTTRGQKGQYVICIHYMLGIQGESESLIVCTDAMPAGVPVLKQIKAEIDDSREYMMGRQPEVMECVEFTPLIADRGSASYPNPLPGRRRCAPAAPEPRESRKSSYDDVLQWLFRDQPSSPPPEYRGRESNCGPGVQSPALDPPLAAATQAAGVVVGGVPCGQSGDSEFPFFGIEFSPLADGLAECKLRSPPNSSPPTNGNSQPQSVRRGVGPMGVRPATYASRGVSTVPSTDPFSLCQTGRSSGVVGMQSVMPSSNILAPSAAVANAYIQSIRPLPQQTPITDLDLPFEEPDLTSLAPFVAQEELQPISADLPKDLQTLFPDLPDWTPAEPMVPAALPARHPMSMVKTEIGMPPAKRAAYSYGPSAVTPTHHYEHSYMQPAFRVGGSSQRTVYAGVQRMGGRIVSDYPQSREWVRVPVHQMSMPQHSVQNQNQSPQVQQVGQMNQNHSIGQSQQQPQQHGGWSMAYGTNSMNARQQQQQRTVLVNNQ